MFDNYVLKNGVKKQKMLKLILIFIGFFIVFNVIPKYPYLSVIKASKLIEQGRYKEGLLLFSKVVNKKVIDTMTKIRYAFSELKFGEVEKAKNQLELILKDDKTSSAMKYETKAVYALVLFKENKLKEAKELMLEVYENYKNTNMYCTLGYLFNILEKPDVAVKFNIEAYDFNSSHNTILDNLGQAYYLNGDYDKAEEIYEGLLDKSPAFPEAYYNYGLVLLKKGKKDLANEMFERALAKPFNNLTTVTKEECPSFI